MAVYELKRVYSLGVCEDLGELAEKLTQHSWTLCTAFRYGDIYFLNDSSGEDSAQEYAVFRKDAEGRYVKIESYTCSWMSPETFIGCAEKLPPGPPAFYSQEPYALSFDHQQGGCYACR